MAANDRRSVLDPDKFGADNLTDSARLLLLGGCIARKEARGKSTARLEARADEIQAEARERWNRS
ncbi:hypothetical protein ACIQF6_08030 [Kitasatospora sp. NPDC092948]|uniref:hypothetical protein n=1 Tax=Kitasatospora sp. NPDC092948 TaxID=3364088 RepID=UPI003820DFDA